MGIGDWGLDVGADVKRQIAENGIAGFDKTLHADSAVECMHVLSNLS